MIKEDLYLLIGATPVTTDNKTYRAEFTTALDVKTANNNNNNRNTHACWTRTDCEPFPRCKIIASLLPIHQPGSGT